MKKSIILLLLMVSSYIYSQEDKFIMNEKNFTDFLVIQKEGYTAKQLYTKTIEWINITYKNPDKVILGKIEDEYIRFEGSKSPLACRRLLGRNICEDGRYQIEVSFKDGKYKFDIISIEIYNEPSQYSSGGWNSFNMNDTSFYYKKDGQPRTMYSRYPEFLPKIFNDLNQSLSDYISGKDNKLSNDW